MTWWLYRWVVACYHAAVRIAAWLGHAKALAWWRGRSPQHVHLERLRKARPDHAAVIWMHVSSLGEYEQGRPVLERLRRERSEIWIAVTFFSPSGYEARKNDPLADWIGYLPPDTPLQARRWIEALRPHLVLWVKYDLWAYHLRACFERHIPVLLFAMNLSRRHPAFRSLTGPLYGYLLHNMSRIFLQYEDQKPLADELGLTQARLAPDPRIDRVRQIALQAEALPEVEQFLGGQTRILILGSAYEAEVRRTLATDWRRHFDRMIVAPHWVDDAYLTKLERLLGRERTLRYGRLPSEDLRKDILLVDRIGLLSRLYRYGSVAFVGGGFGHAIHNTLEPAAFALPVLFGPRHERFPEATRLLAQQAFFEVRTAKDISRVFDMLSDPDRYFQVREAIQDFMVRHEGSSRQVAQEALQWLEQA